MNIVVTDRGAIADARTLNHDIINRAIADVSAAGGGKVIIPTGTFLAGTIQLRTNVTLHLEEGAVLLGSPHLEHYTHHVWGHHDDITPWHFLVAEDCENIAITGRGTIRGNGPAFWEPSRASEWSFFTPRKRVRPSPMVEIVRCRHVLIDGIRIEESPGWTLHGHDCDHLRIEGITIRNSFFSPNGDGIDLTGCHDAIIHGCDIACGDDAIALKTSELSRSCERIAISDCILRTSCVGIRLGFESREDFRDIVVTNIIIPRCTRAIDLRAVEGATIERVRFSNITAITDGGWPATRAIEVVALDCPNVFKKSLPPEHPHFGQDRPLKKSSRIRDISFTGIDITTDGRIIVIGKPDAPVESIRFSDIRLRFPVLDDATPFRNAMSTGFIPADYPDAKAANAAFVLQHARDIEIHDLRIRWPEYPVGNWHMFDPNNTNRKFSTFWQSDLEAIRSGAKRVGYHIAWANDAQFTLTGKNLTPSDPTLAPTITLNPPA